MLEKEKPETGQIGDEILLTGAAREAYLNAPTEAPGANEGLSEAVARRDVNRLLAMVLSLQVVHDGALGLEDAEVVNEIEERWRTPPISLPPVEVEPRKDVKPDLTSEGDPRRNWTRAEAEKALDMRPALEAPGNCTSCNGELTIWHVCLACKARHEKEAQDANPTVVRLGAWLEHSRAHGHLHVAIPVDRAEELFELLTKNSPAVPDGPSVLTPAVHSTLLEMIGLADAGKCMACAGLLALHTHPDGVHGECVIKFAERHPEFAWWKQRTQILTLARKYNRGELR